MRILMLNHNLRGRGTWHRAWRLGAELGKRGHRVELWTAGPDRYYRSTRREHGLAGGGMVEIETPSWAPIAGPDDGWGPLDAAWRGWGAATGGYDLCYAFAHPPGVSVPAWIAKRLRGKPLLYDWCDWYAGGVFPKRDEARAAGLGAPDERGLQRWAERRERRLERGMLRLADRITVISDKLLELALAAGRRKEDVLLLPNGANLEGIAPRDKAQCRRELKLPQNFAAAPIVGYVANYHPDEELLLGAIARAKEQVKGLRFLAAGPEFSAGLMDKYILHGTVMQLGRVAPELIGTVLGASDALALPLEDNANNRARMPFKFTDYLAAGRPIATSPVGDLSRWFGEGREPIGAASKPTVEAYGDALARLLGQPAEAREQMGRAARALAEKEFDWGKLTDRLEAFTGKWLGNRRQGS